MVMSEGNQLAQFLSAVECKTAKTSWACCVLTETIAGVGDRLRVVLVSSAIMFIRPLPVGRSRIGRRKRDACDHEMTPFEAPADHILPLGAYDVQGMTYHSTRIKPDMGVRSVAKPTR